MSENGFSSTVIKADDPGSAEVRRIVLDYIKRYPEMAQQLELYGAVMEIQQDALSGLSCDVEMNDSDIESLVLQGEPLVRASDLVIDAGELRSVLERICGVVAEKGREPTPPCGDLAGWTGLEQDNLADTLEKVVSGTGLELTGSWAGAEDLAARLIWESMFPFIRICGGELEERINQPAWQRGYCPVCGSRPLIGKFREDDGLWLLECSLCHTLWNIQRVGCSFCFGGEQGTIEYLYLDEDRSRRVQYCRACRTYVKTVDLRESEGTVLLPLENIATYRLDQAASEEGLRPPDGFCRPPV